MEALPWVRPMLRGKKIDMVIIGGHGKGLTKLLMGHVTAKVIAKTHCAVLVVEKYPTSPGIRRTADADRRGQQNNEEEIGVLPSPCR